MTDDHHGAALRERLTDQEIDSIAEWASVTVEDVAAMVDEIRERRAAETRIREIHSNWVRTDIGPWCSDDQSAWPCATIRALNSARRDGSCT